MGERIEAVKAVTELFRFERMVYLVLTSAALLLLIGSATALIFQKGTTMAVLTGLFGSSGLITVSLQLVLRMWNRAIDLVDTREPRRS
jgi:hypothetical protein